MGMMMLIRRRFAGCALAVSLALFGLPIGSAITQAASLSPIPIRII